MQQQLGGSKIKKSKDTKAFSLIEGCRKCMREKKKNNTFFEGLSVPMK